MHSLGLIERRLQALLDKIEGVPDEQLSDMKELNAAGEPGVAYENLCTQLYEFDVAVSPVMLQELEALGRAMDLEEAYWIRLKRG